MNTIIKKITAAAASAVIAVCSTGYSYSLGADTAETPLYKVHFELGDDVTIVPDDDGNVPEIKDVEKEYRSAVFMPKVELEREGYYFTGWTVDNIYGYKGGMVYRVPDHDVTVIPVWNKKGDKDVHTVKYSVVIDGEVNEEYEKLVPAEKGISGTFVEISMYAFPRDGYKHYGWTDGTNIFKGQDYIIIHDEDITLTPNWYKKYKLLYTVGDADRVNGALTQEYEVMETGEVNLQSNNRFSRDGFSIAGWHCETDGKDYKCDQTYVMPSSDVVMTPIWNPITYTVVFFANTGSDNDDIRIKGKTDTTIKVPELTATKAGYTFGGWQIGDDIYQPGDDYLIVGAKPGVGVFFNAVWTPEGSETTATTTTSATTTSSATTTTTVTTSVLSTLSTAKPVKAFEISVVDKETGKPINDVYLSAKSTFIENGTKRTSEFPIDAQKDNPKKVDYSGIKNNEGVTAVTDFRIVQDIYNSFAYKLKEEDIESTIKDDTAYYTVKLSKKIFPDDVHSFTHVVKVYDKKTKELINDAVLVAGWNIEYDAGVTSPVQLIDTSAANPAILDFSRYSDAKVCTLTINGVTEDSPYTFSADDVEVEELEVQHIIYHNVYLTKSDITYGDANCDGNVDMADVVLIMQALANPNKYDIDGTDEKHITAKGALNGDVEPSIKGLTTNDALTIQLYLLKKIDKLPFEIAEPIID